MTKEELIKDYEQQIVACESVIQQNLGVAQYCRMKIAQLKADEQPKPEETQK